MTSHIIGAPPEKREATFGESPTHEDAGIEACAFSWNGTQFAKYEPLEVAAHILDAAGVSASVVVHEETGSHARPPNLGGSKFALKPYGPTHGLSVTVAPSELEHIVRQGATLIAQRDAPVENRNKPAPGFWPPVLFGGAWCLVRSDGVMLADHHRASEAAAVSHTWEMHDAQQARKGGES